MATEEIFRPITGITERITDDAVRWAFMHVYHQDCANAIMHCADVRFSPLTFRLAEVLATRWPTNQDWIQELAHVIHDRGQYEEDRGR
jgi:hypothetical protein